MTRSVALAALAFAVLAASAARARADDEAGKREARALIREGNLLLEKHDAAGALSLFNAAYAKFPSSKILISIGSAEADLGHRAAAANAYARYLASDDDDAARKKTIKPLLADLDRGLGRVAITITPADAELQLGDDGAWLPAGALAEWRAVPGSLHVRARRADFVDGDTTATIVKGAVLRLTITLVAVPEQPPPDVVETPPSHELVAPHPAPGGGGAHFGVAGKVVVDGKGRGAAGVLGGVIGLGTMVSIDVAAIVGPTFGAYGGLRLGITRSRLRPVLAAGVPVFFDGGARFGARAAGGLEWSASPRLRMSLELGAEYMFTRAGDIDRWLFAPALAAEARL